MKSRIARYAALLLVQAVIGVFFLGVCLRGAGAEAPLLAVVGGLLAAADTVLVSNATAQELRGRRALHAIGIAGIAAGTGLMVAGATLPVPGGFGLLVTLAGTLVNLEVVCLPAVVPQPAVRRAAAAVRPAAAASHPAPAADEGSLGLQLDLHGPLGVS